MFGILVALPLEARRIVPHHMHIGESYPLSDNAMLIVTDMGASALPLIKRHAESGQFATLISLGTAVGLSPQLTTGTLCIPDEVVWDGQTIRCHQGLQTAFVSGLKKDHNIVQKRLAHTAHVLTSLEEKEQLYHKTRAGVADMESFLIGQEALRCQINFLAIRVILDSMDLHMPQSLLKCCLPTVSLPKLIGTLFRQPTLLFTLLAFAKHFSQAQKTIQRVTQLGLLQSKMEHREHYVI